MPTTSIPIPSNPESKRDYLTIWGPLIILFSGFFMFSIGWLKWGNFQGDYGNQIYIPWQLTEGQVLYRDIIHYHGPIANYMNALVFSIFGLGIWKIQFFNLALVILITFWIFRIFKEGANRLTGTLCGLSFVNLFALSQYKGFGDYNFIAPYTSDVGHGMFLAFLTFYIFFLHVKNPSRFSISITGICLGMVFLSKPEIFLATAGSLAMGITLTLYYRERSWRERAVGFLLFGVSCLIVPFLFWLYFWSKAPAGEAFFYLVSPWVYVMDPFFHSMNFYKWIRGTDQLLENVLTLMEYGIYFAGMLLLFYGIHTFLKNKRHLSLPVLIGSIAALVGTGYYFIDTIHWFKLLRPLPLLLMWIIVQELLALKATEPEDRGQAMPIFFLTFALFSLMLVFKLFFRVHIIHYGFALALPGFLLAVKFLIHDVSKKLKQTQGPGSYFQYMSVVLLMVFMFAHMRYSYLIFQFKDLSIGKSTDRLLDFNPGFETQGLVILEALEFIENEIKPGVPIAMLPSGAMINYQSRHPSPLRTVTYNPLEAHIMTESLFLQHVQEKAPPYIFLVDADTSLLGAKSFGKDYAQPVHAWITQNYTTIRLFGEKPFTGKGFGIQAMRLNPKGA